MPFWGPTNVTPNPFCSVKHAWISYILYKCTPLYDESSLKEIYYWIAFSTLHVLILERLMDPSLKRSQLFWCHARRHTMNWPLRKFSHAERTGEQLIYPSNDSGSVGKAASTCSPVYSFGTSINFSDITNRWKNSSCKDQVSIFQENNYKRVFPVKADLSNLFPLGA